MSDRAHQCIIRGCDEWTELHRELTARVAGSDITITAWLCGLHLQQLEHGLLDGLSVPSAQRAADE